MFKSIRYKFIVIYFILVFIAMAIVGVFITSEFERYHLSLASDALSNISNNIVKKSIKESDFRNYDIIRNKMESITTTMPGGYEILIIDRNNFKIIASTSPNSNIIGKSSTEHLDKEIILDSISGNIIEKDTSSKSDTRYKIKNMIFPYLDKKGQIIALIYGRANLDNIYGILYNSKIIIIKATLIALLITVILGFLIAKSITNPINDVTIKAAKMAKGDFDQIVEVKSDDEIGKLGEMFNYLTNKLKITLLEISGERSKLNAIINQMADGLIAVDIDGQIIHLNPRFKQMMNLNEENIRGKKYDEIIEKYNEKLTLTYLKDKNISSGNEVIKLYDGNTFKANFVYLKNEDKEVKGLILVLQDITEHERLDNMRKEFVANVSHELKTPLTTVKSYTETLLDGAIEDREISMDFLNVINKESDRMARLVKDLLQLAHLDHKKLDFKFAKFNINNLIDDIVKKLDISFKEKKHKLELKLTEKDILINGDKDKIEQVIQNILSNAIKYTPESGIISITTKVEEDYISIEIEDNGIGIPKEDLPRIFERFYRVDKARSRDAGGTGLGLSIAKHIVEEHGGNIYLDSEVGKGSIFKIKLTVDNFGDM